MTTRRPAHARDPRCVRDRERRSCSVGQADRPARVLRRGARSDRGARARAPAQRRGARRRHSVRDIRMDLPPRHRDLHAHGHARLGDDADRHGRRRPRHDLLPQLLPRHERGRRPFRRRADGVRRRDVRPRAHRRHHPARDVLGDHEHPVVSAHRSRVLPCGLASCGAAGPAHDHAGRTRDVRRRGHPRGRGRHAEPRRDPRRSAARRARERGARMPARRCAQQVGDLPVPLLAARRHGRADAGQRLPARGGHGEGGHLSARAPGPVVRR